MKKPSIEQLEDADPGKTIKGTHRIKKQSKPEAKAHTPGPWHRNIKPASHYGCIFSGRNTHVTYLAPQGKPEEEVEANCNLIAAAPELLEAALATIEYIKANAPEVDCYQFARLTKAAIAKATKGKP